jgi:hypothetical protein
LKRTAALALAWGGEESTVFRQWFAVTQEQTRAYAGWITASIRGLKPDYEELFHITNDPNETANLARNVKHQPMLAQLREQCDLLVREEQGNLDTLPLTIRLPPDSPPVPAE